MEFLENYQKIVEENKGALCFVRLGVFYTVIGKQCKALEKYIGLKRTCFSNGICKVGIPKTGIEKIKFKLNQMNICFVIYDFVENKKEKNYQKIYESSGTKSFEDKEELSTCHICDYKKSVLRSAVSKAEVKLNEYLRIKEEFVNGEF